MKLLFSHLYIYIYCYIIILYIIPWPPYAEPRLRVALSLHTRQDATFPAWLNASLVPNFAKREDSWRNRPWEGWHWWYWWMCHERTQWWIHSPISSIIYNIYIYISSTYCNGHQWDSCKTMMDKPSDKPTISYFSLDPQRSGSWIHRDHHPYEKTRRDDDMVEHWDERRWSEMFVSFVRLI